MPQYHGCGMTAMNDQMTWPWGQGGGGGNPAIPEGQSNIHAGIGSWNARLSTGTAWAGMRIVPNHTGTISTIHYQHKTASGYGAGTFGTVRTRMFTMATDGSKGTQIGSTDTRAMQSEGTTGGVMSATVNAPVTAGVAYWIEWMNVDGAPNTNNFSINFQNIKGIDNSNGWINNTSETGENTTTNPLWPYGFTRHGQDPRVVSYFGGYGEPSNYPTEDGHSFPCYWLTFVDGHEEGQPYYSAGTGQGTPLTRTYTVPYTQVVNKVLMHGGGRVNEGYQPFSVTASVSVNGSQIASGIALAGTHNVLGDLPQEYTLEEGDTVSITISSASTIRFPYFDAAMQSVTGFAAKSILPICLIGYETTGGSTGGGGNPADTTAPTVSITGPSAGATVSGSVNLTANASDNVGVVGVQFKVDGANVGTEDTVAPYSVAWNSAGVSDGSHTITAVARDAAGNATTSSGVTVTVDNVTDPPPSGDEQLFYIQGVSGRSQGHQNSAVKSGSRLLYRFIARETGTLNQFWVNNKMSGMSGISIPAGYEGYAGGDGGTVECKCYTTDPSSGYPNNGLGGRPLEQIGVTDTFKIGWAVEGSGLSSYTTNDGKHSASFGSRSLFNEATRRNIAHATYFKPQAPVIKGHEYCLEIRNVHASPNSNFFSINYGGHTAQLAAQGTNTRNPLATGYYGLDPRENVGWSTNGTSYTIPGGQYNPQPNFHCGFLQVYASGNRYVGRSDYGPGGSTGAGTQWQQKFQGSHTFTGVRWFPQNSSSTGGTITVTLYDTNGAVVTTRTASTVSGSGAPVTANLNSSLTVNAGQKIKISFPSQCNVASNDALGIPDGAGLTTSNAPVYAEGNTYIRYQRAIWMHPMPPSTVWSP